MTIVSVIIPAYNAARYLAQAVDSVLAQTHQELDLIVIDDGSTDETQQVLSRYASSLRYFYQPNQGVAVARNRGIAECHGDYVAFLDADDTWRPQKLQRQLDALLHGRGPEVCYCARELVDEQLQTLTVTQTARRASALEDLLLMGGNFVGGPSAVMVRRDLLQRVGGFDRDMSQCADWDMWIRLAMLSEFIYVDEPLTTYRQHDANMSRDIVLLEVDSIRVLEKTYATLELPSELQSQQRVAFARNDMILAGSYLHNRQVVDFFRCVMRSVKRDVSQFRYLISFPMRLASRLRSQFAETL